MSTPTTPTTPTTPKGATMLHSDPLQTLIDTAEPADPSCWQIAATRTLLEGGGWTYGGDSLKHYGDEWTRPDGAILVLTLDGGWYLGLYPAPLDDDEDIANSYALWQLDTYDDVLVALNTLGVTSTPVMSDPARYGCHGCQQSITEHVATGREMAPHPRFRSPLQPSRPLGEYDDDGFPYCSQCAEDNR